MEKRITVDKFEVIYDVDALIEEVESLSWDEENYNFDGETNEGSHFSQNENEFNKAKVKFIKDIENLDNSVEQLFKENVVLTKKGELSKSRRQVIIQSDIIHEYYFHDSTLLLF